MTERQAQGDDSARGDDDEAIPGADDVAASRGTGETDDPDRAGGGPRAGGSTEYTANTEPGPESPEDAPPKAADLDPHEPPGQG